MMLTSSVTVGLDAIGLVSAKAYNSAPMGIIRRRIEAPTIPIGRARSVIGGASPRPVLRPRLAERAERMPPTIGPRIRSRVQIAATQIVPAPMNRPLLEKTSLTNAPSSVPAGIGV